MNLSLVSPAKMILTASSVPVAVGMAVTDEHIQLIALLVSVVLAVAGVIAWIDSRVERGRKRNAELILALKEDLKEVHKSIHSIELNGCAQRCTDPTHARTPLPLIREA